MTPEADNKPSLQVQIKQILRDEINAGLWRQGAQLPPEPELMRRFGVSRITVSQALRDLAADGLVVRRQGKGTFVSSHPQGWTNLGALLQRMTTQPGAHLEHTSQDLACVEPPRDVAIDLELAPGDQAWMFTRTKVINGAAGQWEQAFIPAGLVTVDPRAHDPNDWGRYYFVAILRELTGQQARRCRAFLQAVELSAEVAAATGETAGKPTIEVTRLWHNELGQPVLLTRSVLRPDGTRYFVDLPEIPEIPTRGGAEE